MGNSCSVDISLEVNHIVWIDPEVDNDEITQYANELKSIKLLRVSLFKIVYEAISYLKGIKFRDAKVIVNGGLYSEFVKNLKVNLEDMYVAPKIIVYTSDPYKFVETNKDFKNNNNVFYSFGGVTNTFKRLKNFIRNERDDILEMENKPKKIKEQGASLLLFEYIDTKEKLMLPLLFKSLIDGASNDAIKNFTKLLYQAYSNENDDLKSILYSIEPLNNIPIEILCKYYARIFTSSSLFQQDIMKIVKRNKVKNILPYIKVLYEGMKLRSLPLCNDDLLYIGCILPDSDMKAISENYNKKVKHLPSTIVYSKTFLIFTKDRTRAETFLHEEEKPLDYSKVLFILEKEDNLTYGLSTHCDVENICYFKDQRDVLFFPFSAFEVKHVKKSYINQENVYEIKLLFLDKYLGFIESDKNLIEGGEKLPDTQFRKEICDYGLITRSKIEKMETNELYNSYKKYEERLKKKKGDYEETDVGTKPEENNEEKEISKPKESEIKETSLIYDLESIEEGDIKVNTGFIVIGPDDINKQIHIINSYENVKREDKSELKQDDYQYMNEKEIKENVQMKINDSHINFTYLYRFEKPGSYKIEYIIKRNLTKVNHLFFNCNKLTNLYLPLLETKNVANMNCMFSGCNALKVLGISKFDTQNVVDMRCLFKDCSSIPHLNLSNFRTRNVTSMVGMFMNCKSLILLDLSSFNTQNVSNMSQMFFGCTSLLSLDLPNFNTQNVINMIGMFNGCSSLKSLDLSKFNTQNVNNMYCMFCGCESLKSLNLANFNTQNVTNMYCMFLNCKLLKSLDLSNFNTQNSSSMNWMFNGCDSLKKSNIITKDKKLVKLFESQRVFIFNKKH